MKSGQIARMFPKIVVPQIIHFNRVFHYNHPLNMGYHYFWKHPYMQIYVYIYIYTYIIPKPSGALGRMKYPKWFYNNNARFRDFKPHKKTKEKRPQWQLCTDPCFVNAQMGNQCGCPPSAPVASAASAPKIRLQEESMLEMIRKVTLCLNGWPDGDH